VAFTLRVSAGVRVLDRFEHVGLSSPARVASKLGAYLEKPGGPDFDIERLPAAERNGVTVYRAHSRGAKSFDSSFHRSVFGASKLGELDFARAIVRDGRSILAVVHAFGAPAVSAGARRKLAGAIDSLVTRLSMEKRVEEVALVRAALAVTLEALPGEAWILDEAGEVSLANDRASSRHEQEGSALATRLIRAVRSGRRIEGAGTFQRNGFAVSRVERDGQPRLFLVRALGEPSPETAVTLASRRWGLTEKQTRVLSLLCQGHANKAIAAELGCAENTIEYHVTRLLAKANVESRAELIARVYAPPSARTG
jgi:DNA-binding CsgD family transcriptional regulator